MEIDKMTGKDIEARLNQIGIELENEGADIDALTEETRKLRERQEVLRKKAEQAKNLRKMIAEGAGRTVQEREFGDGKKQRTYDRSSPEYRTAWLKQMARDENGKYKFGEMTEEERSAFTFTTANTSALVPKPILDRIVELVRSQYPIYADATHSDIEQGFGVPRHKAIKAGDAKKTEEGVANDDENDEFDLLDIIPDEIKKTVKMSRKMKFTSIKGFEDWIVGHIAKRIGVAKEKVILEKLDDPTYGMESGNRTMTGTLSDKEFRKIFAAIDQDGVKVVYANSNTIWNVIADIEDASGHKLFIPSTMDDPMTDGRVYGARVKPDSNLPDNELRVGVPASILANDNSELEIFPSIEPGTCKSCFTGYSLFAAGLENPKAFVKYTHTPAMGG